MSKPGRFDGEAHEPTAWIRGVGAAIAAAAAVLLQSRIYDRTAIPMDEGHLAAVAIRLLEGEVLYRDIHTGIAPFVYHVAAALFGLFGRDLLVTRVAQVAVNAGIAALLWGIASRVTRLHWAAVAPALYVLLMAVGFPVLTMLNYSSVALLCALGSLLLLQRHLARAGLAAGLALGVLLAATALTKQNYGALSLAAVGLALLWNRPGSVGERRSLLAAAAPVAVSGAIVAFGCAAYFAWRGAFFELVDATLLQIGGPQLDAFNNPIPPLLGAHPQNESRFFFLYTPPTLFNYILSGGTVFDRPVSHLARELAVRLSYGIPIASLAAAPIALWLTRRRVRPEVQAECRAVVLFAAFFFLGIFPSAIWSHLAFVAPPALLALVITCDRAEGALRERVPTAAGLAVAVALVVSTVAASERVGSAVHGWFPRPLGLPGATLFVTPNFEKLYRGAARFVDRCAPAGEAIFVAPDIPILYFLTSRANPTPYDLIIPGNVDGNSIVARLEADGTRCVVYNPRMYPEFPPFEELFPELDRYLRANFRRAEIIAGEGSEWYGLVREGAPFPMVRSRAGRVP